jgi:hypothetical protein
VFTTPDRYDGERAEQFVRPFLILSPMFTSDFRVRGCKIKELFRIQLRYYLNPKSKGYLYTPNPVKHETLLLNETALLCLILLESNVMDTLPQEERDLVFQWNERFLQAKVSQNSAMTLYRAFINVFQRYHGGRYKESMIDEGLKTIDSLYYEKGWYFNNDKIDLSSSWSFALLSIFFIKYYPNHSHNEVLLKRINEFLRSFSFLFSKDGKSLPWGRALINRFAVSAPFSLAYNLEGIEFDPGFARHIVVNNIERFMERHDVMQEGLLTMGFSENFLPKKIYLVDRYSVAASPYIAGVSFFNMFFDEDNVFWTAPLSLGHWDTNEEPYLPRGMSIKKDEDEIVFDFEQPKWKPSPDSKLQSRYITPITTKWD